MFFLYINEYTDGFGFKWISKDFEFLDRDMHDTSMIRWHVIFNISLLRIISYCMDKYWSYHKIIKFDEKVFY